MLSLTSALDSTILTEIGELPIDLSFNNVLKWYEIVDRDDIEFPSKMRTGWSLFLGADTLPFDKVDDYEDAADALSDISTYVSEDPYVKDNGTDDEQANTVKPTQWFSYKEDAEAIYASFLFDYKIDLVDQIGVMRWEKFRALFNNLSAKSPIMRIIDIRQANQADYEGQALSDLVEAQNYYSLESASAENLNNQMASMFDMLKGLANS